jgi:hypothetical protein
MMRGAPFGARIVVPGAGAVNPCADDRDGARPGGGDPRPHRQLSWQTTSMLCPSGSSTKAA